MGIKLKRILTLVMALAVIAPILHSQEIKIGIKSGMNLSYLRHSVFHFSEGDHDLSLIPVITTGFTGGVSIAIHILPQFVIEPEVTYSVKGARFNEKVNIGDFPLNLKGNLRLEYLDIPVFFRFTTLLPDRGALFYPRPGATFHGYIGPALSVRLSSRFTGSINGDILGVPYDESFNNYITDFTNPFDVGVIVGAGMAYGLNTKFLLDVRYRMGFLEAGKEPVKSPAPGEAVADITGYNSALTFVVGIMF